MTDETQHPMSPDRGPVPDDAQRYKDPDPEVDWDARNAQPDVVLNFTVPLWVARRVFDTLESCSMEAKRQDRHWRDILERTSARLGGE